MIGSHLVHAFTHAALSPDPDLAVAALMIARIDYPTLDAGPYLDRLDELGREAQLRVNSVTVAPGTVPPRVDPNGYASVMALNEYLFDELRFVGNDVQYQDPRNSFLNEVLDRRTGIPITLALAVHGSGAPRRASTSRGSIFPGISCCAVRRVADNRYSEDLIIDAYHGGALLSEHACRELLRRHAGDDAVLDVNVLRHATKPQILARMLLNLKRVYVHMHSFPQARDMTELLLAVDPSATNELRDRGLLAYHLNDFPAALRDLQAYLHLSGRSALDEEEREEHEQIWEHVKTLRRRVASLN